MYNWGHLPGLCVCSVLLLVIQPAKPFIILRQFSFHKIGILAHLFYVLPGWTQKKYVLCQCLWIRGKGETGI